MYSEQQSQAATPANSPSAVQTYVLWAQREILSRVQRQRDGR